ncbi:MAG: preprotein translocase subunit SecY [Candidatus Marinimicrobia bacterium]|nr:preprotein translocase subunit SecY [Candidatus Neomarinimicrobiota bacterium]MCF7827492.1 preprotein translocase subunit SecY [Candidatus Neomarinimicrobiota bacterium]MCF7882378.1 preprotein translocase subunit SecY [Candidatus Neomarinimicrobiota bacterium]
MIDSFRSIFKIPELRKRIAFTIFILVVYRIGGHIPTPGIDSQALAMAMSNLQNTLFGLYDMFAGGSFGKATIFALGIMPYISAAIIIQLLGAVFPYFQRLQKEGEEGQKKITQLTRYGTVGISTLQAYGVSIFLQNMTAGAGQAARSVVINPGIGFQLITVITLVSGTVFVMWLGEQISERGIGNGISLLITIGILVMLPNVIISEVTLIQEGVRGVFTEVVLIALMVVIVAALVLLTQGTRKLPVQYAKRVVGRKVYGGQSTHIPLRINTAGVMPIIFAQAIMFVPQTIATFFGGNTVMQGILRYFDIQHPVYWIVFGVMIIFFTYFYTAIAFNPVEVADNMKRHGGFIPGIRPGKRTAEFIDNILTKITLPGSIFLAIVAVMPYFIMNIFDVDYSLASFFGGTSLLIIVGVSLDTLQQVESHLVMRHYDGFMKGGRIRGRRRM